MQPIDGGPRVRRGLGFAADGEIVDMLQEISQSLSHDRVVIDDQNAPNTAGFSHTQLILVHESTPRVTNAARAATMPVRVPFLSSSIASKRAAGCGAQQ